MSKEFAEIYLKAAEEIGNRPGDYTNAAGIGSVGACYAISINDPDYKNNGYHSAVQRAFKAMMQEPKARMYWFETADERILALCFAAAIVEAGDAP